MRGFPAQLPRAVVLATPAAGSLWASPCVSMVSLQMLCHTKAARGTAFPQPVQCRGLGASPARDSHGACSLLRNSRVLSPHTGRAWHPPPPGPDCDRPWEWWQIPVLRHGVRFEFRSFLSKRWRAEGAVVGCWQLGWAVQMQHKTFPSLSFLLAKGPQEGPRQASPYNA